MDPLFEAEERGDETAKQKRMERNKVVPPETKGAAGAGANQKPGGPATAQPPQGQPPPANAPKKEPTLEEVYDFIGELKREAGKAPINIIKFAFNYEELKWINTCMI